jgi:hypothetical protein
VECSGVIGDGDGTYSSTDTWHPNNAAVKVMGEAEEVTHDTSRIEHRCAFLKDDHVWNLVALPLVSNEQLDERDTDGTSTHGPSSGVNADLGCSIGDSPQI